MSLRGRLLIGLLALAAVGLVALAAVTYVEQRNFLMDRVDQQVRGAVAVASHGRPSDGSLGAPAPADDDDGRGAPRGDGGPPPAGTWLFVRNAGGDTLRAIPVSRYESSSASAAPSLPRKLATGKIMTLEPAGSNASYRVLAVRAGGSGAVVAAAIPLHDVEQTLHRLLAVEALVIGAILAALAALAWWLVGLGLRPLNRMEVTAGAIAAGDLTQRVEDASPRTEVGRLGLALNRMLDQLERAFAERQASEDRLRRFLADASHELRTPLSSIRGYSELFRIGAAREPHETEKAMSRIESEAARMGVLVEDLLTLARLDEVRDVIREPVELGRLAAEAVDDARATAPDRTIDLHSDGGATVHGDPHQLRQVLGNLLRNALVHTPAGTPIDVDVAHDAGGVTLEVRDHGSGLPDGSGDELFERFWRAEAGRERGKAGAGLGLAIVAGIVHAHGGEVHAGNADGGGARFTVRLPT